MTTAPPLVQTGITLPYFHVWALTPAFFEQTRGFSESAIGKGLLKSRGRDQAHRVANRLPPKTVRIRAFCAQEGRVTGHQTTPRGIGRFLYRVQRSSNGRAKRLSIGGFPMQAFGAGFPNLATLEGQTTACSATDAGASCGTGAVGFSRRLANHSLGRDGQSRFSHRKPSL